MKAGNNIITLDAAETQRWHARGQRRARRVVQGSRRKGIDGPKLAQEAEALIAKYSK